MSWWLAVALLAPLAAGAQAPPCPAGTPTVDTSVGRLCGVPSSVPIPGLGNVSASAFLGIPYARPPVGALRWQSPQPLDALPKIPFLAKQFGNKCPQSVKPSLECALNEGESEDCLYLNVWAPSDASPGAKYPVMVFIHGGAFLEGTGGASQYDLFDGTYLAASGKVILVTLNYRLGVLGFLSLAQGLPGNNFGLQDQVQALQWVQQNIASFGGDPDNVTLFGESAGAMSVGLLTLSSSQTSKLFRAAMTESNPLGLPYKTTEEANRLGNHFSRRMGCLGVLQSQAECMVKKSACELVGSGLLFGLGKLHVAQDMLVWAPAIDGTLLNGKQPVAQGGSLSVPLLLGTNQAEGILFGIIEAPFGLSQKEYGATLENLIGKANVAKVQKVYPCTAKECSSVLSQVITDYIFSCANRHLAIQAADAASAKPVYAYQFNQVSSFNLWKKVCACADEVCHGDELPYVFNTAEKAGFTFTEDEEKLSQTMGGYWTSFAASQNPNGGNLPEWPLFSSGNNYLTLVHPPVATTDPFAKGAHCADLWDGIGYPAPGTRVID